MIVIERPLASLDIIAIAETIARAYSLERGKAFYDSAQKTFMLLAQMPEMGSSRPDYAPELPQLRQWRVKKFEEYLIFYLPLDQARGVEIVRVIHGKRDLPSILEFEEG